VRGRAVSSATVGRSGSTNASGAMATCRRITAVSVVHLGSPST
jgi:hypothetical protein